MKGNLFLVYYCGGDSVKVEYQQIYINERTLQLFRFMD